MSHVAWSVCLCVGTWVSCATTGEPVEMPLWALNHMCTRQRCWHCRPLIRSDKLHAMPNITIFGDLHWPSRSFTYCKPFKIRFFVQLCSNWQDFNWRRASHGPSAIVEVLITFSSLPLTCQRLLILLYSSCFIAFTVYWHFWRRCYMRVLRWWCEIVYNDALDKIRSLV